MTNNASWSPGGSPICRLPTMTAASIADGHGSPSGRSRQRASTSSPFWGGRAFFGPGSRRRYSTPSQSSVSPSSWSGYVALGASGGARPSVSIMCCGSDMPFAAALAALRLHALARCLEGSNSARGDDACGAAAGRYPPCSRLARGCRAKDGPAAVGRRRQRTRGPWQTPRDPWPSSPTTPSRPTSRRSRSPRSRTPARSRRRPSRAAT
mmetsp:Transcript_10252/g.31011  ORF Transcript_10252/g.31011 Transcript_10252/m.31011 type:complete len:209 (+) Transcript_10252:278-904(+)